MGAVAWVDGRLGPLEEMRVPVTDHGLLYGDGVFEGIRLYGGRPFLLTEHLQRLRRSARALALNVPWSDEVLTKACRDAIEAFARAEGYLRLIITRGDGPLGIDPALCPRPRCLIIVDELRMVDEQVRAHGAKVIIASTRRLGADGLDPRIKSLNYLNHILARLEANACGADEALLLNGEGRVAEGSADNVFIVRDGRLVTPPPWEGALAGVTRALVMRLAVEDGVVVEERPLAPYDLYNADECFLTGTGAELIPVREVDGRTLSECPGPVFRRCRERFRAFVQRVGAA